LTRPEVGPGNAILWVRGKRKEWQQAQGTRKQDDAIGLGFYIIFHLWI
jgi:hypothetical protein